jgi:ABC-type transport system involved in cytochrome c biogenesis permease subunit
MPPFVRALASLKLTVILLLSIAALLSLGTILESLRGAEAGRAVYFAPWFFALQGVFALNIVAALWERWPRNRYRVGFLITHMSVLLILGGALATAAFTIEGRLPLWEGQSGDHFLRDRQGEQGVRYALPFSLRLDAFEMDVYPGTHMPAMFRSRVTLRDPSGAEHAGIIEMNRPLSYGGFQFFQSSYQVREGREMSILSVSRDPGQPIVFLGYGLLVLGMLVVLATRIAQSRVAPQGKGGAAIRLARGPGGGSARAALIGIGVLALAGAAATAGTTASAAETAPPRLIETIRRLPVQSDGRTMPFDTQAREAVRIVTGSRAWRGLDPVAMAMGWTIDPEGWSDEPIVRVTGDVATLAGLRTGTRHASYQALLSSQPLRDAVGQAHQRQQAEQKPWPIDKHLLSLEERLVTLDSYLHGQAIRAIPVADPIAAWEPPANPGQATVYAGLEARIRPTAPPHYPSSAAIDREIRYNALQPTRVAWLLLLPAAIAAGLTLGRDRWRLRWVAGMGTLLGFLVMTLGIAVRWQIAGRIPASNIYESLLFLGWGVGLFGVASLLARNRMLIFNASAMSALVMLLLDRLPIDPFIHPMPPALSGTPWLAIHVPIIMVSYSVFAIATFLAHLVLGAAIFAPGRRELAVRWSGLLYWYLVVGSILLIAGILTGSIWAASSWGRYWGWDPKEVWSLVAFLAYMAILHARIDEQIDSFGVAVSSIVAFWTILMTYLGVNFVLATGLHSYGFASTNLVSVMGIIAFVETAFILAAWWAYRRRRPVLRPRAAG